MEVRSIVELVFVAMLPLGLLLVMIHRITTGRSLTLRSIQFMAVIVLIPTIAVLSMEKIVEGATVGTLLGGLTGYLLSGLSNNDEKKPGPDNAKGT